MRNWLKNYPFNPIIWTFPIYPTIQNQDKNKSQKILRNPSYTLRRLHRSLKYLIVFGTMLINLQNRPHIPTPVTVVRRRPYRHQFLWKYLLVPLHDQLMCPANQTDVVCSVELLHCVLPEQVPRPSGTHQPSLNLVGVRPHQVAHRPDVWDLLFPVQWPNVVQVLNVWRKTTVNAKNLVIDDCCQRKVIKNVRTVFPNVQRPILPETLVIKPINLRYLPGFVISTNQEELTLVSYFVC